MQNIRLTIEYDGTRYRGFEHIRSHETISARLSDALFRLTGEEVKLFPAVKTEPGIHASAQTVSFCLSDSFTPDTLKNQLNKVLPADIAVLEAASVPERFHAALNLTSCTYLCRIDTSAVPDIFSAAFSYHVPDTLDISSMEEAASYLCGTHDFSHFSTAKTKKSCIRSITEISLIPSAASRHLCLRMTANSFLRKMPQFVTAVLLEAGLKRLNVCDIPLIFSGETACPAPYSPKGLCLIETNYLL